MTDVSRKDTLGPRQIHAPLKAWFDQHAAQPTPEHLLALVDELEEAFLEPVVKKAS